VKRFSLRTLIVAGSAIAIVTSVSPLAFADNVSSISRLGASDNPQIGTYPKDNPIMVARTNAIQSVGDAILLQAQDLAARLDKKGRGASALRAAITAFQTARTNALTSFNYFMAAARSTYSSSTAPAQLALQSAQTKAQSDLQSALASAKDAAAKQAARIAFRNAVTASNNAFKVSTQAAVTAYRAATVPAHAGLLKTLTAANKNLHVAIKAVRGATKNSKP
jgi:hypothetical protein